MRELIITINIHYKHYYQQHPECIKVLIKLKAWKNKSIPNLPFNGSV